MQIRNIATLVVAIFLGLIAVIMVRGYLAGAGPGNAPVAAVSTVPVVVAAQPVARGVALQPGALKVVNFPRDSIPAGAFQSVDQLTGAREGPRLVLRSLAASEPILPDKISAPGGKLNLSEVVDGGMRAVSLRSNDVAGVGGFVLPGDRVDVLLTRSEGSEQTSALTQVLAESVLVLGIDQSDNQEADKPVVAKAVTVEVTPDQAQTISLGQAVGTISLALRRVMDGAQLTRRATTVADLNVGIPRKPPAAAAAREAPRAIPPAPLPLPPETVVRVVRGVDAMFYAGTETSLTPVIGGRAAAPPPPGVAIQ